MTSTTEHRTTAKTKKEEGAPGGGDECRQRFVSARRLEILAGRFVIPVASFSASCGFYTSAESLLELPPGLSDVRDRASQAVGDGIQVHPSSSHLLCPRAVADVAEQPQPDGPRRPFDLQALRHPPPAHLHPEEAHLAARLLPHGDVGIPDSFQRVLESLS